MKRTRIRKTAKKDTIGYWKKNFWKVFSKYIRERDNYTCITCDKKATGSGMHAGHFVPKSAGGLSLYFDERNVNAQCYRCNINLGGNGAEYYRRMIERYGEEAVEDIFYLRDNGFRKYSIEDYKELIEEYKEKLKEFE